MQTALCYLTGGGIAWQKWGREGLGGHGLQVVMDVVLVISMMMLMMLMMMMMLMMIFTVFLQLGYRPSAHAPVEMHVNSCKWLRSAWQLAGCKRSERALMLTPVMRNESFRKDFNESFRKDFGPTLLLCNKMGSNTKKHC